MTTLIELREKIHNTKDVRELDEYIEEMKECTDLAIKQYNVIVKPAIKIGLFEQVSNFVFNVGDVFGLVLIYIAFRSIYMYRSFIKY